MDKASKINDTDIFGDAATPASDKYTDPDIFSVAPMTPTYTAADIAGLDVPKWGRDNPTLYASAMTALDLLPAAAGFIRSTPWGLAAAPVLSALSGYGKRAINGQDTSGWDVATDAGKGAVIEGAGRALTLPVGYALNKLPQVLTKSAAKMGTVSLTPGEQSEIADTLLRYNVPFTEEGGRSLESILSNNAAQKMNILRAAEAQGKAITPAEIINTVTNASDPYTGSIAKLLSYGRQTAKAQPNYVQEVTDVVTPFAKGNMTPTEAVANQRALGKKVDKAWRENTQDDATVEAQKQLYLNFREWLNNLNPAMAGLNKESSDIMTALPYFNRATNRIGNRDVVNLGDKVGLAPLVSTPVTEISPSTWGKVAAMMFDNPKVKSATARGLYRVGNANIAGKALKDIATAAAPAVRGAFDAAILGMGSR